jgi:hypothetical protein
MSVYEMSRLSALVGVTSKSDVQMTRRIAKVVLHSKFNAAIYVSCYKKNYLVLDLFE